MFVCHVRGTGSASVMQRFLSSSLKYNDDTGRFNNVGKNYFLQS